MPLTVLQLQQILPDARSQAGVFISALNTAMIHRNINTPKRIAAFLAQVGHESGQLQYVRELGSDSILEQIRHRHSGRCVWVIRQSPTATVKSTVAEA